MGDPDTDTHTLQRTVFPETVTLTTVISPWNRNPLIEPNGTGMVTIMYSGIFLPKRGLLLPFLSLRLSTWSSLWSVSKLRVVSEL